MNPIAKGLIGLGFALIALGLIWQLASRFNIHLGRLPGDIAIEKPGFNFYFPLTTCILISVLITGIVWLIRFFRSY